MLKGAHQDELIAAIRAVHRGEAVFGANVADRVLRYFASPRPVEPPLPELTARNAMSSSSWLAASQQP